MIEKFLNKDCMEVMSKMPDKSINLSLTDIPYNAVNRDSNGLRNLDKDVADVMTFELLEFLEQLYRITSSTIIIFCGKEQFSLIFDWFNNKQKKHEGTVRQLTLCKSNPSPMNGQHIYLSDTENAVWFKKRGGTFNAHCKGTVFTYPCARGKLHPTEKPHGVLKELILDNSNEGDIVFDPCAGSGSTLLVAKQNNRQFIGCELNKEYYGLAYQRLFNKG